MLDVHPPHEAAHSWKDFFIHIVTIVIGLLIAIGLEQTVEFFHHRNEIKETREALKQERETNRRYYAVNTAFFRRETATLQNNLRVLTYLQLHPGTPEPKLPGVLMWDYQWEPIVESVWKNAEQTQALALLPREEAQSDAFFYEMLEMSQTDAENIYQAMGRASSYAIVDPDPSHLTPTQVTAEIDLAKEAARLTLHWAAVLAVLQRYEADFPPGPSPEEIGRFSGKLRSASDQQQLAAARAISNAGLASSDATVKAALQATGESH